VGLCFLVAFYKLETGMELCIRAHSGTSIGNRMSTLQSCYDGTNVCLSVYHSVYGRNQRRDKMGWYGTMGCGSRMGLSWVLLGVRGTETGKHKKQSFW